MGYKHQETVKVVLPIRVKPEIRRFVDYIVRRDREKSERSNRSIVAESCFAKIMTHVARSMKGKRPWND